MNWWEKDPRESVTAFRVRYWLIAGTNFLTGLMGLAVGIIVLLHFARLSP